MTHALPTFADVRRAADRLAGVAHRTPVLTSSRLDAELSCEVFFKAENFQRVGAFKFRGAYNAIASLDADARAAGVVAVSSGNHAQAMALAGRLLQVPVTIVMPTDAPAIKLAATRGYGAQIVPYDRYTEDREQIARDLAGRHGYTFIPPFNHPDVIAGQGTAALELIEEVGPLDAVFTPLGGGGLLSGTALTVRALSPDAEIIGVEPAAGDDVRRSLEAGRIVRIDTPRTIADGAQTQAPGDLTFALIRQLVTSVETATDEELLAELRVLTGTLKIVVEPTGCLGLAGLRGQRARWAGRRVGVLLSGGNVDPAVFGQYLAG